jgi:hypothetical protein
MLGNAVSGNTYINTIDFDYTHRYVAFGGSSEATNIVPSSSFFPIIGIINDVTGQMIWGKYIAGSGKSFI